MIPILSNKQAKLADLLCIKNQYASQEKLMDNAGMLSAQFFVEKIKNPFNKKVLIVAGKGNNGSDAIIMHHYLLSYGVNSNFSFKIPFKVSGFSLKGTLTNSASKILQSSDKISITYST